MSSKPKLLVILGAGSSIPCGMPSVSQIDNLMKCWSQEWASDTSANSECDVFNILWETSERYTERTITAFVRITSAYWER